MIDECRVEDEGSFQKSIFDDNEDDQVGDNEIKTLKVNLVGSLAMLSVVKAGSLLERW